MQCLIIYYFFLHLEYVINALNQKRLRRNAQTAIYHLKKCRSPLHQYVQTFVEGLKQ